MSSIPGIPQRYFFLATHSHDLNWNISFNMILNLIEESSQVEHVSHVEGQSVETPSNEQLTGIFVDIHVQSVNLHSSLTSILKGKGESLHVDELTGELTGDVIGDTVGDTVDFSVGDTVGDAVVLLVGEDVGLVLGAI